MDVKVKAKTREVKAPYRIDIRLFSLATMFYNCIMCICFCFVAWSKGWWGVLLLIPVCILFPSYESEACKDEDVGDKNNE